MATEDKIILFTILTGSHNTYGDWMLRGWIILNNKDQVMANFISF